MKNQNPGDEWVLWNRWYINIVRKGDEWIPAVAFESYQAFDPIPLYIRYLNFEILGVDYV